MPDNNSFVSARPLIRYLTIGGGVATIVGTLIALAAFSRDLIFTDSGNTKTDQSQNRSVRVEGNASNVNIVTGDQINNGDPETKKQVEGLRGDVKDVGKAVESLDQHGAARDIQHQKSLESTQDAVAGVAKAVDGLRTEEAAREVERRTAEEEAAEREYRALVRESEDGLDFFTSGDLASKRDAIEASLGVLEQLGRQEGVAKSYLSLGAIAEKEGQLELARKHWTKAAEHYQEAGVEHMVRRMQERIESLTAK